MNNYRKVGNGLSPSALQLRKRILKNRSRAIGYGLLYLLGIVALAVVVMMAFPPVILHKPTNIIELLKFLFSFEDMNTIMLCVLFITMLVIVLLNVFRGFAKLNWLCKKTANDTHGFNRNVYAMLDLGKMFSMSFVVVLINYFLINLLKQEITFDTIFSVVFIVGLLIHFFCGLGGAKVNFYDVDNGQVIEQKRVIGRLVPFVRNLLQVIMVIAAMYFLLVFNEKNAIINPILTAIDQLVAKEIMLDGFFALITGSNLWNLILMLAIFVCLTVLATHATGITEYNIDGVEGRGMRISPYVVATLLIVFAVIMLLIGLLGILDVLIGVIAAAVLAVLGIVVLIFPNFRVGVYYFFALFFLALVAVAIFMSSISDVMDLWLVVAFSAIVVIVEIVMLKLPKYPEDRILMEKVDRNEEREIAVNDFSQVYADSVVESTMDKSLATREDMEKNYVDNQAAMAAAQQKVYPNTQPSQPVAPYANPYQQVAPNGQPAMPNGQQGQMPQYPNNMYPMPYPVPYPQQQPQPQSQLQQSWLPIMAGMSMLPLLSNMTMLPNAMNNLNGRSQGDMLPSQVVREALMRNGSANDLERILFSDSELYGKGKQGRKAAKARAKAIRMMARLNDEEDGATEAMDEKAAMDADLPIKIGVECPCCHKKLNVTSVAMYNRCPSCKTVFQVRKSQD